MKDSVIDQEFKSIEKYLFDELNWQGMEQIRTWANSQPSEAGVYMLFEKCKPVYVGETGSIATFEMSAIGRRWIIFIVL